MSDDPDMSMAPARDESDLPYALYILVELSNGEITEVEAECNSDDQNGCFRVQRAPSYNIHNQSLRAAFCDFIQNVESSGRFEHDFFIAVVDPEWRDKGVVIVARGEVDDAGEVTFDKLTVPTGEVGDVLINLSVGNLGWSEFEEVYGRSEWEVGMMPVPDKPLDREQTDEEFSDGASRRIPEVGYWIGLYAVDDVDFESAMRALDGYGGKSVGRLTCRPQGRVPATTREESIATAARLHPMRCRNNPRLHRMMFLVIDTPKDDDEVKNEDDGILIVRMNWDEDIDTGRSLSELARIGASSKTDYQRLCYNSYTTLKTFHEISEGSRPWRHQHKTFFAYAGPRHGGRPDVYLRALDRTFETRESGSKRFLGGRTWFDTDPIGRIIEDWREGFKTVLRQHWGSVHQERFRETLVPGYFVYCDRSLTSADVQALVTLVKVDKDGTWSAMKCRAGDAYETLCALVEETRDWEGVENTPEE